VLGGALLFLYLRRPAHSERPLTSRPHPLPDDRVGVDERTLTYGVTLDDSCLAPDTGNVVIYLYQDSGAYYSEDAVYQGNDVSGNQIWQATFTFDPSSSDTAAFWLDSNTYAGTWHAGAQVPGTTTPAAVSSAEGSSFLLGTTSSVVITAPSPPTLVSVSGQKHPY